MLEETVQGSPYLAQQQEKQHNMKTHIVLTLCIMVVLVATTVSAEAIIGVSPSRISFEDVLRGGYAEKIVTITVSSDKETTVTIEPRGDIAKWLEFSEEEFTVTRGQPHRLRIAVNPPEDSPNQNYTGFLRLKSVTPGSGGRSGATGTVIPVLDLFMIVEITDIEFVSCIAKDYGVHSVEEGEDLFFTATVANNGNIRLNPKMHIDIWDLSLIHI